MYILEYCKDSTLYSTVIIKVMRWCVVAPHLSPCMLRVLPFAGRLSPGATHHATGAAPRAQPFSHLGPSAAHRCAAPPPRRRSATPPRAPSRGGVGLVLGAAVWQCAPSGMHHGTRHAHTSHGPQARLRTPQRRASRYETRSMYHTP
jgi:hypothetical protein